MLPTFRRPHLSILLPDLDADLDRLAACHTVSPSQPAPPPRPGPAVTHTIDIDVDWNTQDDTGLPWTFADEAH